MKHSRSSVLSASFVAAGSSLHLSGRWRSFFPLEEVEQESRGHRLRSVRHQHGLHTRAFSPTSSSFSPSCAARSRGTARELSTVALHTTHGNGPHLTKTKKNIFMSHNVEIVSNNVHLPNLPPPLMAVSLLGGYCRTLLYLSRD